MLNVGPIATALVLAVIAISSVGGYSRAPDAADARATYENAAAHAAARARATAYRAAFKVAETCAKEDAARKGRQRGRKAGIRRARKVIARRAEHAKTADAATQCASVPTRTPTADELPLSTPAPAPVNGSCAEPFTYHMGICKISRPARPSECPPGWMPAGMTGACAPRE